MVDIVKVSVSATCSSMHNDGRNGKDRSDLLKVIHMVLSHLY